MSERPAPRLRTVNRQQIIPAMPLENLLDSDHQARLVWDFCQGLDLTPLYDSLRSRHGGPGHPAIDPRICVALWLYATLEGVGSARALAWLCQHHNAFRWLTGGVSVNHHTLADFRVGHLEFLDDLLTHSVAVLREQEPMRERAQGYLDDPTLVKNIIEDGCDRARKQATETMREVRAAVGLAYD